MTCNNRIALRGKLQSQRSKVLSRKILFKKVSKAKSRMYIVQKLSSDSLEQFWIIIMPMGLEMIVGMDDAWIP